MPLVKTWIEAMTPLPVNVTGILCTLAAVPTFVVNGNYTTDVTMAGGPEKLMSLLSDLAAQEHRH